MYKNYRVQFLTNKADIDTIWTAQAAQILTFKWNTKGFYFVKHQLRLYTAIEITKNCLFSYKIISLEPAWRQNN